MFSPHGSPIKDCFSGAPLPRSHRRCLHFTCQSHIIAHTMRSISRCWFTVWLFFWAGLGSTMAAPKPHTVVLGQWQSETIVAESGPEQRSKNRDLLIYVQFNDILNHLPQRSVLTNIHRHPTPALQPLELSAASP